MLRKEQKERAEKMAQEIAPLFRAASRLGDKWIKANRESAHADQVARVWQYHGDDLRYCDILTDQEKQEHAKEAAELYATNKKDWHEVLYHKYEEESRAETETAAARANYLNYLYYICEYVSEMIRPLAFEIYETRGAKFQDLAEILNTAQKESGWNAKRVFISIYITGTYSDSISLDIYTHGGGACGLSATTWRFYKPTEKTPRETTKPIAMTGKQYADRLAKLKQYEDKAREIQREQWKAAKKWGMLDACELLASPKTEKAR